MCFLPEAANGVICLLVIALRQTRYQLYLEQLTPKAERHVNPELSWGIHSFYGQPVPAPHHCHGKELKSLTLGPGITPQLWDENKS